MALSSDVGHAFTLNSAAGIPTHFSKVPGKHSNATFEGIRAEYHCGGNQKYFACNGLDPSIFFLKLSTTNEENSTAQAREYLAQAQLVVSKREN